ncbi:MAG: dephospho-CoA kinase, partial [Polyangia bacterium]
GPGQPAQIEIARAWPVVDDRGVIDRKKLAAIVFSDEQSRKRLEAITHPHIRARVAEQAAALAKAGHPLAFLEAALLVETGFYRSLQGLVLVTAGEETRIARVMQRDGCSRASVLSRMAAQAPLATKLALADYVVDNDGTPEATAREVARMLAKLA